MSQCPEKSVLEALVQCRLSEEEQAKLEEHISGCPACQDLVDQLEREAPPLTEFSSSYWGTDLRDENLSFLLNDLHGGTEFPLPATVGSYRLLRKIGQGGMGTVYAAEHIKMKREVAIKFIQPKRLLNPSAHAHFDQEVAASGKLMNAHVVVTTDAGDYNGQPYLVMELLQGETIRQYLEKQPGKLPVKEACEIISQAAEGLQSAHEVGLLHCDIKPSNLWRLPDGTIKVLDLGLARSLSDSEKGSFSISGTPGYIAPEQYTHAPLGAYTDVYSLGCTLYYLLTGISPTRMDGELDEKKQREFFKKIPQRDLRGVVQRMMAPEPEKRFQSMREVQEDLAQIIRGHAPWWTIALSYVMDVIALVLVPILFGLIAFFLARYNKRKGSVRQGNIQMVLAVICMVVGIWLGTVIELAFRTMDLIDEWEQELKQEYNHQEQVEQPALPPITSEESEAGKAEEAEKATSASAIWEGAVTSKTETH